MKRLKYTKEVLEQHVPFVTSNRELARNLGLAPTGSNTTNLAKRCKQHGIDTSHFTGQAHQRGKKAKNRLNWEEVLVLSTELRGRETVSRLRRAMLEAGKEYKCNCGNTGTWLNKPLSLQIDHINGQFWDNRKENLRFICPNCHTQTHNWGKRKRGLVT